MPEMHSGVRLPRVAPRTPDCNCALVILLSLLLEGEALTHLLPFGIPMP